MNCACRFSADKRFAGLPDHLRPRILSGFRKSELEAILSAAKHQQFVAPSVIVHQGEAAERWFLLTSGQGAQFVLTKEGLKVPLLWLSAGQSFGGATMVSTPCQYLASTEVHNDACALIWEKQVVRGLISRFPHLLDNALSVAATERIAELIAARISLSINDAPGRVARVLVSLARGIGMSGPDGIEILIRNEDIAAGANVTPHTVSRFLAAWERVGILKKGRGSVLLRRPELLLSSI
jgi:CRP-like cAMP-binding protein